MKLKLIVVSVGLIFISFLSKAQKINLSNFYLNQDNTGILLSWAIDAGPTCNGITVWHSTDSINYTEIGNIAGICGNTSSSIPYNFKHSNPILNKTNYYKIRLGFSQFSEVKFMYLEYIVPGKLIIKPNPASNTVSLVFNNDKNETFNISIVNSAGLQVYEMKNINENNFIINTSTFEDGQYYIILMDSGGRTIKEKLLISK